MKEFGVATKALATIAVLSPLIGITYITRPPQPHIQPQFLSQTVEPATGSIPAPTSQNTSLPSTTPPTTDGCYSVPVSANTPTGIAGCIRWGEGIASHYGPGSGVAMNFCTWVRRHTYGCGLVTITSLETGITVTAPVIDFGDLYTGTPNERIVDLQWGVVEALGLDVRKGLYPVEVWPA